jgi:hypothetical protein
MKPFCALGADVRKQRLVIKPPIRRQGRWKTGESQMRTISFILAFAFVLAGPSMAGSFNSDPPGIGTFSYSGSPIAGAASWTIVVAAN